MLTAKAGAVESLSYNGPSPRPQHHGMTMPPMTNGIAREVAGPREGHHEGWLLPHQSQEKAGGVSNACLDCVPIQQFPVRESSFYFAMV